MLSLLLGLGVALILLGGSAMQSNDPYEAMRKFSRAVEFDFSSWTVRALFQKAVSAALKAEKFLTTEQQGQVTNQYLAQLSHVQALQAELTAIVSSPHQADRQKLTRVVERNLARQEEQLAKLGLLEEAILQTQTEQTLNSLGFGVGGQVIPPVMFQVSDLPLNLIVSPRTEIKTVLDISLIPGLDAVEKERIESGIFSEFDHAALVEPVGGLGAYPTMVMRSTSLNWLAETVAHEWIHNYLTLRPLGMRYGVSAEMRTINETVASLAGKEISRKVIRVYHPQWQTLPTLALREARTVRREGLTAGEEFDFRSEMRKTRVRVDELLAQGRVAEAERYMEERRVFFWENGYRLRKINQAYFAFYGSYNDTPGGGASGSDPVGPAVQALRAKFSDLYSFLRAVENITSFEGLLNVLDRTE